jgi:hypothetical protein
MKTKSKECLLLAMFGIGMLSAQALPPDPELTIPPEDRFDPLVIEGVNDVALYPQFPESWTVTNLTGAWRKRKLDESSDGKPRELTEQELQAAAGQLLGDNAPQDSLWREGFGSEYGVRDGRYLFLAAFSLDKALDPQKQSCRFYAETLPQAGIYVNGRRITDPVRYGWVPLDLDISKHVVPGRNSIALSFGRGQAVSAESCVLVTPAAYAKRMLLNPDVAKDDLNIDLVVQSNRAEPVSTVLRAEVSHSGEKGVIASGEVQTTLKPGETWLSLSLHIPDAVYWGPENPHLYEVRLFDKEGQCLARERFGFRQFIAKGRHFYLNGKPVRLFGMQWNSIFYHTKGTGFLAPLKPGEGLLTFDKRYHYAYLKGFKMAGLNSIRLHSGSGYRGRGLFEACDELGILHYDDWNTSHIVNTRAEGPVREHLADVFRDREAWLYYGYNHPSTALYSFGNEYYTALKENLDALYHHIKPLDGQARPLCSSSGRIPGSLILGRKDHIDFADDHGYLGSMLGSWLKNREYFTTLKARLDEMYGTDTMPLVNFELGGGFLTRYDNDSFVAKINRIAFTEPVDRAAYLQHVTNGGQWGWEVVARFPVIQAGIRVCCSDEKAVHLFAAENMKRIWEIVRQDDILEGVGPHQASGFLEYVEGTRDCLAAVKQKHPDLHIRSSAIDPATKAFVKTPGFYAMRRCYSPEFVSARWFDRNLIAGRGAIETAIYAVNDTSESHAYQARVLFRDPGGKVLHAATLDFGAVPAAGGKTVEFRYPIPKKTPAGDYQLEMFLFRDGERVSDNRYGVWVFAPSDVSCEVKTGKKVAFYAGKGGSERLLKAIQAPFDRITDLKSLERYQVLILGADSMDETVVRGGEAIRKWVEAGGRLLCFEQQRTGHIPWTPAMKVMSARAAEVADLVEPKHPAFVGLDQRHFDTWSGQGTLYTNVVSPMNLSAIAIGAAGYVMQSSFAATVLSDVALGKGISVVSLFDVTERYNKDAIATRLANNLVRHILSDETSFSRQVEAGKPFVVLETDDCDSIDLKPCFNSSFMDEVANDGKGGWDDYGPQNDLRSMTTGTQLLAGVPFTVVDSRANKDRSCIILQHERLPRLPAKMAGIKVDGLYNALYFLHTSTSTARNPEGETLYSFVVHYVDGKQDELAIRRSVHVCDWTYPNDALPGSTLAWTGECGDGKTAGVYYTEWKNPRPEVKVSHVDFVGTGKTVAVLIAITGYKGSAERGWLAPKPK